MSLTLLKLVTESNIGMPRQFAAWLDRLLQTTNAHGKELINVMPQSFMASDVSRLLEGAEEAGWIVRMCFEPSANDVFLGAGGIQGPDLVALNRRRLLTPWGKSYSPAWWFNWAPGQSAHEARDFASRTLASENDNGR